MPRMEAFLSAVSLKTFSFKKFSLPLFTKYRSTGSTKARRYPLSYILSGSYSWGSGQLDNHGVVGYWWSATAKSSANTYYLYVSNSSGLGPQGNYDNNIVNSLSLRCTIQIFFFQKIFHSTGSTKARRYPLSYIFSGYYYWGGGNLNGQGTYGYWWSTSANSSTYAYNLYMDSSALGPQGYNSKALGFPLRYATKYFLYTLSKTHHANA